MKFYLRQGNRAKWQSTGIGSATWTRLRSKAEKDVEWAGSSRCKAPNINPDKRRLSKVKVMPRGLGLGSVRPRGFTCAPFEMTLWLLYTLFAPGARSPVGVRGFGLGA